MRVLTVSAMAMAFACSASYGKTKSKEDPCEKTAYGFAIEKQKEDYPGKEFKKSNPSDPEVEFSEQKKNGFETWNIHYSVDEECLEGYELLVRRSADGQTCKAIKETSDNGRDCG